MSQEWLSTLEYAANETNTLLLFQVIEQIRPQNAALSDALAALTDNFEYEAILAILQQLKKPATG